MAQKILGLDIGESAVKAVCVSRGVRGDYRVIDAVAIDINAKDGEENGIVEALKRLFENTNFQGCACSTSLPVRTVSFRTVTLPFKDKKKIKQTILFELEPLIQYPIEEVFVEYNIVRKSEQSEILAAIVRKSLVKERAEMFARQAINLTAVDIDAVTVASWLILKNIAGSSEMILDVGARDTVVIFVRDGQIVQVRHYGFGGDVVSEAIARDRQISIDEAEQIKKAGEVIEGEVSRVCQKFYDELKNTISSLLWHEILSTVPARILLTGGGALYKPVQDGISQCLSVPVEWIDIASSSEILMDDSIRKTWNGPVMNQALSLAVRSVKKNLGFNFNALELETQARYGHLKSYLKWGAVLGALGIVLLGAEIYLDYQYVRLQLQNLKNEIASEFRKISPETTRIVDPLQQLKTKITEARNITLDLSQANSDTTVLDILKDISTLIPASTECLIMSFVYENNTIVMKGQAKNFDAVDTIKKELLKSKFFETITIGPTSLAKQGDKVDFDFRITMKK